MKRLTYHELVEAYKRELLVDALTEAQGSRTIAAERLGMLRTYLCRLIRQYDIDVPPPVLLGGEAHKLVKTLRASAK